MPLTSIQRFTVPLGFLGYFTKALRGGGAIFVNLGGFSPKEIIPMNQRDIGNHFDARSSRNQANRKNGINLIKIVTYSKLGTSDVDGLLLAPH